MVKDTKEKLIQEFVGLLDRAIAFGGEEAVARIISAAVVDKAAPKAPGSALKEPPLPPPQSNGRANGQRDAVLPYGAVKNAVRQVIAERKGVKRSELPKACSRVIGRELTDNQVAEALRTLSQKKEIVSRGRKWFSGPQLDREKLGIAPSAQPREQGER